MSQPRPFPRSLDPLTEESLTGYVLRLAHRLDLPVNPVALLGGLIDRMNLSLPVKHVVALPAHRIATFAAMTRLTAAEVTALTLDDLATRYPPLSQHDHELRQDDRGDHRQRLPRTGGFTGKAGWGWFGPGTRFCPICLAGDNSPIQTAHGGPWRKHWRLTVVFACPIHHQLLRSACPGCHLPPQHGRAGQGIVPSYPEPLHPAQCRTKTARGYRAPRCEVRLDQLDADPQTPAPGHMEHLLRVQQRLLGHLGLVPGSFHNTAGHEATPDAAAWFHDLRLGMGLIRASWPAARSLAPGWIDLDAIDRHVQSQEHEQAQARDAGKRSRDAVVYGGPPVDTLACANLLALVEHLLARDGADPASGALDRLCSAAQDRPGWGRYLGTNTASNSPWLRAALAPHINRHLPRRSRGLPRALRGVPLPPPARRITGIQPKHLGHRLPRHVVAPLLDLTGTALPARDAHRYLVIRLVQAVLGCDMITAAREVDLPTEVAQPSCWRVHRWAEHHGRQADLALATDRAAAACAQHTPLIDYQHRRHELHEWIVPLEVWNERVLPLRDTFRRPAVPLDDHQRIIASILIWQDITAGDTAACPLYQNRKRLVSTDSAVFGVRILQTIGRLDRIRHQYSTRHYMLAVIDALADYHEHLVDCIDRRASATGRTVGR